MGAFLIAASFLVFFWDIFASRRKAKAAGLVMAGDPWDGRSLEWILPSPTPAHNFDVVPTVSSLDEFWHRKYGEDGHGRLVRIAATADVSQKGDATDVHLPSPSYWPIVLAFGLPWIAYGLIYNLWFCVFGAVCIVSAIYGWVMEPSTEPGGDHKDPEPDSSDKDPEPDSSDASGDVVATLEGDEVVD